MLDRSPFRLYSCVTRRLWLIGPTLCSVVLWLLPGLSIASCGDWLDDLGHQARESDPLLNQKMDPAFVENSSLPQPRPCIGPECRQRKPGSPVLPIGPKVEYAPQQPAWLTDRDWSTDLLQSEFSREISLKQGRYVPFILERPPRS